MFSLGGGEKRGPWNENIFPGDILSSSFDQVPAFSRVGGWGRGFTLTGAYK